MHSFENLPFYRGVTNDIPLDRPSLIRTRKDRKPRDTPVQLHDAANKWFKASFNVAYRSEAVFLTPSLLTAQLYAKSPDHCVRIVPIGNYSYCWSSKCSDFMYLIKDTPSIDLLTIRLIDANYQTANLDHAHRSGNELMLSCDNYIAVPVGLLSQDVTYLQLLNQ